MGGMHQDGLTLIRECWIITSFLSFTPPKVKKWNLQVQRSNSVRLQNKGLPGH